MAILQKPSNIPDRTAIAPAQPLYNYGPQHLVAQNLAVDAAAILIPETDIATGTRWILDNGGRGGTYLVPCLKTLLADLNGSAVTIVAFGRNSTADPWQPLYTADNAGKSATLTTATATDVKDATYRYTYGAPTKWFNRAGCRQVLFGVTSGYTGAGVATAELYVQEA